LTLTVTGRRVAITATSRQDIRSRVGRLERVLKNGVVSGQCVISRQRALHVCELTVHARGDHILHGVGRHARLTAAVKGAFDKVGQQAKRLADRRKTRRKAGG
jgi:ribosomal subunit interface protein